MEAGFEPRPDTLALFFPRVTQTFEGQMDMETHLASWADGVSGSADPLNDASSSVLGNTGSSDKATRDEGDSSRDSDSDIDSLPLKSSELQVTTPAGCPHIDTMVPGEYVLKLSTRFTHNLSTIREERDQALQRWEQVRETNSSLTKALRAEKAKRSKLENSFKFYRTAEIVRIPVWPPHEPLTPPSSATKSSVNGDFMVEESPVPFLYDNPLYQGYELNVNIIILRVKALVENKFPGNAIALIDEALEKAQKLKYAPLSARCLYWKGRIYHLQKRRQEAAKMFLDAMPCIGRYREGEDLKRWLRKYEDDIDQLSGGQPPEGNVTTFRIVRRRPPRNVCVPAAELPRSP
ncbi:predicted protein [Uncinocarpus reesii 1704]|uniref:Uncharacterized protein n=1 Tax=Uncinocarpus reesii (strain UAMH 1704) TaxID=336963 RepID=C4JDA9_UNCRE|nr:uncharacterized protein UREG_00351 [Uncinocarpus reesii 1704]EEP75505.1 predicted protein [Uncinocarpus reesii 1704]